MGEDSLLERVTAAAEERELSQNTLIAYRSQCHGPCDKIVGRIPTQLDRSGHHDS